MLTHGVTSFTSIFEFAQMQVMFVRLPQRGGTASARQVIFYKSASSLIVGAETLGVPRNKLLTEHCGMDTAASDSGVSDVCADDIKKRWQVARNKRKNFIFRENRDCALRKRTSSVGKNRD